MTNNKKQRSFGRSDHPDAWLLRSPIYLGILLPAYTEITQISDLRFILSEYEHHPKMMWAADLSPGVGEKHSHTRS